MPVVRPCPPLVLPRRLVTFSRRRHVPPWHHLAASVTRRHSRALYSTAQPDESIAPTVSSAGTPPLTPAASLLASFLAHPPPTPLPSSLLHSAPLLSAELRLLHRSLPLFVGFSSQLPLVGSHFTVECGGVSVVLVRGEDGVIRALFNNCTHQNARICTSSRPDLAVHLLAASVPITAAATPLQSGPTCHYATRLVCPFHHWTFGLDGQHLAPRTPLTRDPEQRKAFALRRATVEELDGVLWVKMKVEAAEAAGDAVEEVAEARRPIQQRLAGLSHSARGSLLLQQNWKAVLAALSQRPSALAVFPSAVYTQQPAPLLLQLLPLSEQLTAVTAYAVGTEAELAAVASGADREEEWRLWVNRVMSRGGERFERRLDDKHGVLYHRLIVRGLSAEVAVEEKQRKDVEARRNKLLGMQ